MEKEKLTIHTVIDLMHSDPQGVSNKFGIPLKTVYNWCSGSRKPPKYIIIMMIWIIELQDELERGLNNGTNTNRLGTKMEGYTGRKQETGEKGKSTPC